MTKNSISVKKEFKQQLLASFLKSGVSFESANVVSTTHVFYLIEFKHVQQVFELGFWFCHLTGHLLFK